MRINIGFFDGFKGKDTLLIEADREGVSALATLLLALSEGAMSRVDLHRESGVTAHGGMTVIMEQSDVDPGVRQVGPNSFLWQRSQDGWANVAAQVVALRVPHPAINTWRDHRTASA